MVNTASIALQRMTRHLIPIGVLFHAFPALAACDTLLPGPGNKPAALRAMTADDLLRLRDVGDATPVRYDQRSPLAISPNGRMAAFVINQADPASNSYCRALVTIDLRGAPNPRIVNRGGEFIKTWVIGNGGRFFNGVPPVLTPIWSPDGRSILFLRRDNGVTQLWQAYADGRNAMALTHSAVDVEDFSLSADGKSIAYASRSVEEAERRVDREALSGWHYDARISAAEGARPRVAPLAKRRVTHLDLATGTESPAGAAETALLPDNGGNIILAPLSIVSKTGERAWISKHDASRLSPQHLFVKVAGKTVECLAAGCDGGFAGFWWDAAGRDIIYIRQQGWNKDRLGLYRWRPGTGELKQILDTPDVIVGCVPEGVNLLCTHENSLQPRQIVRINLATGTIEQVFDPNPELKSIHLGYVERLKWTSSFGLRSWGDLTLPPDYQPGQMLPMIVVQYHSRGFQRGGIGDEYPIQLFAARGYAVLHVDHVPDFTDFRPDIKTELEASQAIYKDLALRKTALASFETALNIVVGRGIVDPARIGITGLSSGSENARYALVNSHLFAAASISGDGNEPRATMIYYGGDIADRFAELGLPRTIDMDASNRDAHSMAENAKVMHTPLLMQVADHEFLSALEGYTALHEAGQPVDMYVFSDEYHQKWQPAHRAAIYARNLDWFDFWLKGVEDPDPAKRVQYDRWEKLRAAAAATPSLQ